MKRKSYYLPTFTIQKRKMNNLAHCLISVTLEKIDGINNKSIVFGGGFNLFFEAILEAQGGNPVLKKKSLAKLINKTKIWFAWYLENLKLKQKRYTFRQQRSSVYIQRRLDYFFISNVLQESVKVTRCFSCCFDWSFTNNVFSF